MSRPPVRAVLVDFDGVAACVDVEGVLARATRWEPYFTLPIRDVVRDHFYLNPHNRSLDLGLARIEEVREAMRPALWTGPADLWDEWWEALEGAYAMPPAIRELLAALRGRVRLGMISDNHLGFRRWLRDRPDIGGWFDVLVCSAEEGMKKPDPRLFRRAAERLGATVRTLAYLDDDAANVRAARAQGIRAVHVRTPEQARDDLLALLAHPASPRRPRTRSRP